MAGFVQIMQIETSRIDELETLMKSFQEIRGDALWRPRPLSPRTGTDPVITLSLSSSTHMRGDAKTNDPLQANTPKKSTPCYQGSGSSMTWTCVRSCTSDSESMTTPVGSPSKTRQRGRGRPLFRASLLS